MASKGKGRKGINRQKRIEELKKEIDNNNAILKKNIENYRLQVQIGLYGKGLPREAPMYDTLLEKMKLDIEQKKIELSSCYVVINPVFKYTLSDKWREIQMKRAEREISAMNDNIIEIEKNLKEVEKDIADQNERIKARNEQILGELKELGANDKNNYIG